MVKRMNNQHFERGSGMKAGVLLTILWACLNGLGCESDDPQGEGKDDMATPVDMRMPEGAEDMGVEDLGLAPNTEDMQIGVVLDMYSSKKVCGDEPGALEDPIPVQTSFGQTLDLCACTVEGGEIFVGLGQPCPGPETLPDHPLCRTCFSEAIVEGPVAVRCLTSLDREEPNWEQDGYTCLCEDAVASFDEILGICQGGVATCDSGEVPVSEADNVQCTQTECQGGIYADFCGASPECLQSIGCDCGAMTSETCVDSNFLVASEPGLVVTRAQVSLLRGDRSEHFIRWHVASDTPGALDDATIQAVDLTLERRTYEPLEIDYIGADLERSFFTSLCAQGSAYENVWVLVRYTIAGARFAYLHHATPGDYCAPSELMRLFPSAGIEDDIGLLDVSDTRAIAAQDCYCDLNGLVTCRHGGFFNPFTSHFTFNSASCRDDGVVGPPDELQRFDFSPALQEWSGCENQELRMKVVGPMSRGFVPVEVEACPGTTALDFQDVNFVSDTNSASIEDASTLHLFSPLRAVTSEGANAQTLIPVEQLFNQNVCDSSVHVRAFVREGSVNRATSTLSVSTTGTRCRVQ